MIPTTPIVICATCIREIDAFSTNAPCMLISILQNETMDKYQFECIKAATNEVAALQRDGYVLKLSSSMPGGWWMRFLKHLNGNFASVEMNANRTQMEVRINGKVKKCQSFGASI